MRKHILSTALLCAVTLAATGALAQQEGGRQRGGFGGFDPEQMRQRMAERMKEDLQVNDEEWQVIEPLFQKVTDLQRAGMGGRFGRMRGGRGGERRGLPEGMEATPTMQAAEALNTALESESTSAAEIKEKLAVLRKARAENEAALKVARDELRKVLSVRQEAVLVARGTLD